MPRLFSKAALGGTFDIIHKGHELIFQVAFSLSDTVIIGLTSDTLVKRLRKPHRVEDYDVRMARLVDFLRKKRVVKRAIIVPLQDPYGPTVRDKAIEAIIVSEETLKTAHRINRIRVRRGFRPLSVIAVGTVMAQDQKPISTTRIRRGEIDRSGRLLKRHSKNWRYRIR